MATVTLTFKDAEDGLGVDTTIVSDPMPSTDEEVTPAQKLAIIVLEYLERLEAGTKEAEDDAA